MMEKLVAVNDYHGQRGGMPPPVKKAQIVSVKHGINRAHVQKARQPRVRPMAWEITKR